MTVDYDRDVLPLTPAGNPTERHMVLRIVSVSDVMQAGGGEEEIAVFFAKSIQREKTIEQIQCHAGDMGDVRPFDGMALPQFQDFCLRLHSFNSSLEPRINTDSH